MAQKKKNNEIIPVPEENFLTIDSLENDIRLQRLLVIEHFFKKKGVTQLSKLIGMSPLDLRYFLNSVEAYNLYNQLKEEFEKAPKVSSVEELQEFLVEKIIEFLGMCSPSEAANIVDLMIPHVVALQHAIGGTTNNNSLMIENSPFSVVGSQSSIEDGTFYSPLELVLEAPKLYTDEDMKAIAEKIPIEGEDGSAKN